MQKECERINYEELMTNILNLPEVIVENEIQTAETLIFTVVLHSKEIKGFN